MVAERRAIVRPTATLHPLPTPRPCARLPPPTRRYRALRRSPAMKIRAFTAHTLQEPFAYSQKRVRHRIG